MQASVNLDDHRALDLARRIPDDHVQNRLYVFLAHAFADRQSTLAFAAAEAVPDEVPTDLVARLAGADSARAADLARATTDPVSRVLRQAVVAEATADTDPVLSGQVLAEAMAGATALKSPQERAGAFLDLAGHVRADRESVLSLLERAIKEADTLGLDPGRATVMARVAEVAASVAPDRARDYCETPSWSPKGVPRERRVNRGGSWMPSGSWPLRNLISRSPRRSCWVCGTIVVAAWPQWPRLWPARIRPVHSGSWRTLRPLEQRTFAVGDVLAGAGPKVPDVALPIARTLPPSAEVATALARMASRWPVDRPEERRELAQRVMAMVGTDQLQGFEAPHHALTAESLATFDMDLGLHVAACSGAHANSARAKIAQHLALTDPPAAMRLIAELDSDSRMSSLAAVVRLMVQLAGPHIRVMRTVHPELVAVIPLGGRGSRLRAPH